MSQCNTGQTQCHENLKIFLVSRQRPEQVLPRTQDTSICFPSAAFAELSFYCWPFSLLPNHHSPQLPLTSNLPSTTQLHPLFTFPVAPPRHPPNPAFSYDPASFLPTFSSYGLRREKFGFGGRTHTTSS